MARYVVLALVVIWTAASVPAGLAIWPPAAGSPPAQVAPAFTIVSLFEGAAFALGVVFLVCGGRLLAASRRWTRLSVATYAGIAWLLMSWWPHDGLHRSGFGRTFAGLAAIDLAFHTSLILAAAVVALFVVGTIRRSAAMTASRPAAETAFPGG